MVAARWDGCKGGESVAGRTGRPPLGQKHARASQRFAARSCCCCWCCWQCLRRWSLPGRACPHVGPHLRRPHVPTLRIAIAVVCAVICVKHTHCVTACLLHLPHPCTRRLVSLFTCRPPLPPLWHHPLPTIVAPYAPPASLCFPLLSHAPTLLCQNAACGRDMARACKHARETRWSLVSRACTRQGSARGKEKVRVRVRAPVHTSSRRAFAQQRCRQGGK